MPFQDWVRSSRSSGSGSRYFDGFEGDEREPHERNSFDDLNRTEGEFHGIQSSDEVAVPNRPRSDEARLKSLASPCARGSSCTAWRCAPPDPLNSTLPPSSRRRFKHTTKPKRIDVKKLDEIMSRLTMKSTPSEKKPSGELVCDAAKAQWRKRGSVDMRELTERLSQRNAGPKGPPSTGDRIVMEANSRRKGKGFDMQRLKRFAQASRRGANCSAWHCPWPSPPADPSAGYSGSECTPSVAAPVPPGSLLDQPGVPSSR